MRLVLSSGRKFEPAKHESRSGEGLDLAIVFAAVIKGGVLFDLRPPQLSSVVLQDSVPRNRAAEF